MELNKNSNKMIGPTLFSNVEAFKNLTNISKEKVDILPSLNEHPTDFTPKEKQDLYEQSLMSNSCFTPHPCSLKSPNVNNNSKMLSSLNNSP